MVEGIVLGVRLKQVEQRLENGWRCHFTRGTIADEVSSRYRCDENEHKVHAGGLIRTQKIAEGLSLRDDLGNSVGLQLVLNDGQD